MLYLLNSLIRAFLYRNCVEIAPYVFSLAGNSRTMEVSVLFKESQTVHLDVLNSRFDFLEELFCFASYNRVFLCCFLTLFYAEQLHCNYMSKFFVYFFQDNFLRH